MNKAQARFMIEPDVNEKNLERVKKEIESVLASIDLNDDKLTDEAKTAFEALKQAASDSNTDVKALDAALEDALKEVPNDIDIFGKYVDTFKSAILLFGD
jgi:fumarate hydratase class II